MLGGLIVDETRVPQGGNAFNSSGEVVNYIDIIDSLLNFQFARKGGIFIDDTSVHEPEAPYQFIAIQAIEDAELKATGNILNADSITLAAGISIYGIFSNITLTSGKVIAYQG
jgi:hypothetical protein